MTEALSPTHFPNLVRQNRKQRRGRQLRPPSTKRLETRYAARIFEYIDITAREISELLDPELQAIIQEQERDVALHPPVRLDDAADKISRVFRRVKVNVSQMVTLPRIEQQAERTGRETNGANEDFNTENVEAVLGVKLFTTEPWLENEMDHFVNENASLIQDVTDDQIKTIEQTVFRAVRAGESTRSIQDRILEIVQGNKRRAKLIARDQVNKFNGRLTQLRQQQIGITEYTWRTADDERVRPDHRVLDDTVQKWAEPPVTVTSGKRAGEQNHPGMDIQCLPANSNVVPLNGAVKLYRRFYRGKLTTLVTDDGATISATPNHPVLTERGWVGIGVVNEGENIFKASCKRILAHENHIDQPKLLIGDVFDAALKVFPPPVREVGITGQFHGDGTDEEVCIVNTDGGLRGEPDAPLDHRVCEEILARADQHIPDVFLGSKCPVELALMGLWPTTDGIVRGARKLFSLFTTQLTHADKHRSAAASWLNPILQKAVADNSAAHSVFFGDSLLAFPGKIVGDERFAIHILSIVRSVSLANGRVDTPTAEQLGQSVGAEANLRRGAFDAGTIAHQSLRVVNRFDRDHSDLVFNVETPDGWYIADNYILKNCRCIAEAIFPDELGGR